MFFCLVAFAALGLGLGVHAGVVEVRGHHVVAQVVGCSTEPAGYGRWLGQRTTCTVVAGGSPMTVSTSGGHPTGADQRLLRMGGDLFDPVMIRNQLWWLPIGALACTAAWWAGFPPRTDLGYGRHAAPRSGDGRFRGNARRRRS